MGAHRSSAGARWGVIAVAMFASCVAWASVAYATSGYMSQFNTRYGTGGSRLDSCAVCHASAAGGGTLNPYGSAWMSSYDFGAVESPDSDGDGASNITEINARTFPGDASDKPAPTPTPTPTSSPTPSPTPAPTGLSSLPGLSSLGDTLSGVPIVGDLVGGLLGGTSSEPAPTPSVSPTPTATPSTPPDDTSDDVSEDAHSKDLIIPTPSSTCEYQVVASEASHGMVSVGRTLPGADAGNYWQGNLSPSLPTSSVPDRSADLQAEGPPAAGLDAPRPLGPLQIALGVGMLAAFGGAVGWRVATRRTTKD